MITQDRTATAIELERVLDDLLPLLRTIQPAKLNATLNALATALEGRGERLGENLELVDGYFTELNPAAADDQGGHLRAGRRLADLCRRRPGPGADAAQLLGDDQRPSPSKSDALRRVPRRHRRLRDTTREFLDGERAADHPARPRSAGPPSTCSPSTRPSTRACSRGWRSPTTSSAETFANGELHITLEVVRRRARGTSRARSPPGARTAGRTATACPNPPRAVPGQRRSTTAPQGGSGSAAAIPGLPGWSTRTSGLAGSAEEQRVVDAWSRPQMGVPADEVPDLATLLFGPMARGTAVGQS